MGGKNKKYIPRHRHNPDVQARKIDKLSSDIQEQNNILDMINTSYDNHMEHLSSFAKHDLGNAVQSMYAILKILSNKLDEEDRNALKTCIDNMQNALNSFEDIVPYSKTGTFMLSKLLNALETLTRYQIGSENIDAKFIYNRSDVTQINQPFQSILQLLHNLTINSIKALKNVVGKKLLVIEAVIEEKICTIVVKDTGCGISDEHVDRVFEYKFTTTNGCGIGLYHAKYVCDQIDGSITLDRNLNDFSTIFTLKFNIDGNQEHSNN